MRRRDFIIFLGSSVAEWPFAVRAQQPNSVRIIGVLTGGSGSDSTARLDELLRALAQLGWIERHSVRFDIRRGGGDLDNIHKYAVCDDAISLKELRFLRLHGRSRRVRDGACCR